MASLTTAQIEAILAQYAEFLTPFEISALREALIMRAAQPNAAEKLQGAIYTMPEAQRKSADQFVAESQSITAGVMARGIADLNAVTDDEWERMLNGG